MVGNTNKDSKDLPDRCRTFRSGGRRASRRRRSISCGSKDSATRACRRASHNAAALDVFRKAWDVVT